MYRYTDIYIYIYTCVRFISTSIHMGARFRDAWETSNYLVVVQQPSLLCLFFQRGSIPELLRCASGHNLHFTQPYWLHDFQAAGFLVVFPRMAFLPVKIIGVYICECSKRKWTNIPFEGFGQIAKNDQKICKIGGFSHFFLTIVESSPPPTLPLRCYHLRNSARRGWLWFWDDQWKAFGQPWQMGSKHLCVWNSSMDMYLYIYNILIYIYNYI